MGKGIVVMWAAACVGIVAVVSPPVADADVTEPAGRCIGTASFERGTSESFTVSSVELGPDDVTTIPRADTVTWTGRLVGVAPQQRDISGYVRVDMPWPLPDLTLDSWDGSSQRVENSDVKEYSLPSMTPRGVTMRVYGEHSEAGTVFCSGSTKIQLDGSRIGPWSMASVVLFLASAALAALASRRASAVLGVVAGFLTLLFAALSALFLGLLPLDSALLTIIPVLGLPLGFAWAKAALLAKGAGATAA